MDCERDSTAAMRPRACHRCYAASVAFPIRTNMPKTASFDPGVTRDITMVITDVILDVSDDLGEEDARNLPIRRASSRSRAWLKREGLTYPAMPMDGGQPSFFTFNGKAFPATDTIRMKVGETLRWDRATASFTPSTSTVGRSSWWPATVRRCHPRLASWLTRSTSVRVSALRRDLEGAHARQVANPTVTSATTPRTTTSKQMAAGG